MAEDPHAALLVRLDEIAPDEVLLQQICRGCVELLGVSGAAVILMSEEESGALTAAFGARVTEVEDLQFALGEGPCLEAFRAGGPVLEPELLDGPADRWPEFARQASKFGARAVFVLPLQLGAIRLGVLYLYRDQPGMLSTAQLAQGVDLAELAMVTILQLQTHAAPGDIGPGLAGEWTHRAAVHQATGLVATQLNIRLDEALSLIRAHAFATQQSIYAVGAEIVSGRLRLER